MGFTFAIKRRSVKEKVPWFIPLPLVVLRIYKVVLKTPNTFAPVVIFPRSASSSLASPSPYPPLPSTE